MPDTASALTRTLLPLLLALAPQHGVVLQVQAFTTVRPPSTSAMTPPPTCLSSSSTAGTTASFSSADGNDKSTGSVYNVNSNTKTDNAAANPTVSTVPSAAFSLAAAVGAAGNDGSTLTHTGTSSNAAAAAAAIDWDWRQLAQDVFAEDKRPIILFDGVCNLCNGGVNFALDQDATGKFRFCSLQSKVGQSLLMQIGRDPNDMTSIILLTGPSKKEALVSSAAVARICTDLDAMPLQLFGKLGQITPPFLREAIYDFVSSNRYQFGEVDSCRMDYDGTLTSRFVVDPPELDDEHDLP